MQGQSIDKTVEVAERIRVKYLEEVKQYEENGEKEEILGLLKDELMGRLESSAGDLASNEQKSEVIYECVSKLSTTFS